MYNKTFLIVLVVLSVAVLMTIAEDAVSTEDNPVEEIPKKTTKRGIYGGYGLRGLGYGYYGGGYGYYGGLGGYGYYGGYYPYYGYYGYPRYYPYYGFGYGGYGGYFF
ncbi:keratin-associated protein 19-2-like [Diorhabda sublineata]|uniref:keratin-associated protein 19-2-like n=1 Tax=Diorhabda sublineata TaxID=1163346 RepID=UPI0024E0B8CD|nr:keratin-associated protein 19-2-like [Diorhabda sublineata]